MRFRNFAFRKSLSQGLDFLSIDVLCVSHGVHAQGLCLIHLGQPLYSPGSPSQDNPSQPVPAGICNVLANLYLQARVGSDCARIACLRGSIGLANGRLRYNSCTSSSTVPASMGSKGPAPVARQSSSPVPAPASLGDLSSLAPDGGAAQPPPGSYHPGRQRRKSLARARGWHFLKLASWFWFQLVFLIAFFQFTFCKILRHSTKFHSVH